VTRDPATADRCRGVLLGLAAGDRNGGPTEFAVCLAESLAERRAFDRDDMLQAAVYFVTAHASFDAVLAASLAFAGSGNYCPVLVGAIDGACWGASATSRFAEEVIAQLESLGGADVRVTLEIDARIPNGAPVNVVRIVTENCPTLKFESQGFEKESSLWRPSRRSVRHSLPASSQSWTLLCFTQENRKSVSKKTVRRGSWRQRQRPHGVSVPWSRSCGLRGAKDRVRPAPAVSSRLSKAGFVAGSKSDVGAAERADRAGYP
jgi:hypothetical protein